MNKMTATLVSTHYITNASATTIEVTRSDVSVSRISTDNLANTQSSTDNVINNVSFMDNVINVQPSASDVTELNYGQMLTTLSHWLVMSPTLYNRRVTSLLFKK